MNDMPAASPSHCEPSGTSHGCWHAGYAAGWRHGRESAMVHVRLSVEAGCKAGYLAGFADAAAGRDMACAEPADAKSGGDLSPGIAGRARRLAGRTGDALMPPMPRADRDSCWKAGYAAGWKNAFGIFLSFTREDYGEGFSRGYGKGFAHGRAYASAGREMPCTADKSAPEGGPAQDAGASPAPARDRAGEPGRNSAGGPVQGGAGESAPDSAGGKDCPVASAGFSLRAGTSAGIYRWILLLIAGTAAALGAVQPAEAGAGLQPPVHAGMSMDVRAVSPAPAPAGSSAGASGGEPGVRRPGRLAASQAKGLTPLASQTASCGGIGGESGGSENAGRAELPGQTGQAGLSSQAGQEGGGSGTLSRDAGVPLPSGPRGSLGETARLLGEAETLQLKTRLAKEETACLKAQIEAARLRRELAAAGGAGAVPQVQGGQGAASAGAPAGVPSAGQDAAASGRSGPASGGTPARAGTLAREAAPAKGARRLAPAGTGPGRIVSVQNLDGTLTAAVRTPDGSLAMLKTGSRWAGGRVCAVTPRGLRIKAGSRTVAVPF